MLPGRLLVFEHIESADLDLPSCGWDEVTDAVEQRGFAGSVLTVQDHQLTGVYAQVYWEKSLKPLEFLAQVDRL